MNSYALAFGILGGGVVLATLLWLAPRFKHRRTVRQFRKALDHVDLVTLAWAQGGLDEGNNDDLRTTLPESRRFRKRRNGEPDDGGASLV